MEKIFQIAIDGPGGAGKSTIAKKLAEILKIEYIDTGAMYRAVGYKVLSENINLDNCDEIENLLNHTDIDFKRGFIYLDGKKLSDEIRAPEISKMASIVSQKSAVREKLIAIQRDLGKKKSVIMDGRDVGTNVLPDAKFKFYLNASTDKRAKRRYDELIGKGEDVQFDQVLQDIEHRDYMDMNRELNPLRKADDAMEIDTSEMNVEDVLKVILKEVE